MTGILIGFIVGLLGGLVPTASLGVLFLGTLGILKSNPVDAVGFIVVACILQDMIGNIPQAMNSSMSVYNPERQRVLRSHGGHSTAVVLSKGYFMGMTNVLMIGSLFLFYGMFTDLKLSIPYWISLVAILTVWGVFLTTMEHFFLSIIMTLVAGVFGYLTIQTSGDGSQGVMLLLLALYGIPSVTEPSGPEAYVETKFTGLGLPIGLLAGAIAGMNTSSLIGIFHEEDDEAILTTSSYAQGVANGLSLILIFLSGKANPRSMLAVTLLLVGGLDKWLVAYAIAVALATSAIGVLLTYGLYPLYENIEPATPYLAVVGMGLTIWGICQTISPLFVGVTLLAGFILKWMTEHLDLNNQVLNAAIIAPAVVIYWRLM
jgi:hypothetical protein